MKNLLLVAFIVFLLIFGSYCLFFPKSVQAIALRAAATGITAKISTLSRYIQSDGYVISVRAVGLITYVLVVLLAIALYRGGA
ncbi:MAG: hypothetical protein ACYDEV_15335 [Acidiferrobacter sp.]